ncbi:hypothetical protein QBC39DRAFT_331728 [Podospora conica]|nr:hypothetical protein QBC39DRAFT_331728 [Schizothecium conicum]
MEPLPSCLAAVLVVLLLYLFRLNQLLGSTPDDVRSIWMTQTRWTKQLLRDTYARLEAAPITTQSYASRIPRKLERRYVVSGGSGLVGGYIVLQLLERGQPPDSIRIVDFRKPSRDDVEFVQTDISSAEATNRAFAKPWPLEYRRLPLTVFHTAAVIVPSDRSKLESGFCESVNVRGTCHVLDAARAAGADVFISTTSASISIRPVQLFVPPWKLWSAWKSRWPRDFVQVLDTADFWKPLRTHDEFYANYPESKAVAERIVCRANSKHLRTGCIRPANGVYGNPTDNTVGGPLNMGVLPTWTSEIVQSFVHGINTAIAHLDFEAILASPDAFKLPQAGRPFVVTDPNPPIKYADLYYLIKSLAITRFHVVPLPPIVMVLLSYVIEAYTLARLQWPWLQWVLPPVPGDMKHLKPAIFSICTHLVASNEEASKPVAMGGLGYSAVLTTLEGMTQEVVEWNHVHRTAKNVRFQSSVSLAEEIQRATSTSSSVDVGHEEHGYVMINPKVAAWMTARISCCSGLARNVTECCSPGVADAVRSSRRAWNSRSRWSSNSLPSRRSASRQTTIRTTPMQVAAKAPLLLICQDDERKHASMVYQFQSIFGRVSWRAGEERRWELTETLHVSAASPPPPPWWLILDLGRWLRWWCRPSTGDGEKAPKPSRSTQLSQGALGSNIRLGNRHKEWDA